MEPNRKRNKINIAPRVSVTSVLLRSETSEEDYKKRILKEKSNIKTKVYENTKRHLQTKLILCHFFGIMKIRITEKNLNINV